ncbi:hypothetical protein ABE65_000950 [Fictibacillus phosphorivorans]|uniref:Uncharacterized protein n=1 Tax=Fictibacillus phosphorivorans TaxID=1221500 RepID=A0A168VQ73_9BACL|nr:hypothetical protein [Fictibacillus phosphorivorans]ANC75505.1 hypothetical protein ABE65_000950 [Fictibacillus phosphorivorans]
MKFKMTGMKQLQNRLKELENNAEELEKTKSISFEELFTNSFMHQFTSFSSMEEMIEKSPYTVNSSKDFAAIPDDEWDVYVRSHTSFTSWQEMLDKAGTDYAVRKLGF